MGRFETPITNPKLADKLQGLDLLAITVARSEELSARIDDFIETYGAPKSLDYTVEGETHTYSHTYITALGRTGTLLHARLHEYPLPEADSGTRNLVVTGSLYSSEPAMMSMALSTQLTWGSIQPVETVLSVGQAAGVERSLRPVPDAMTEPEWEEQQELDRILELEAQRETMPQIRFGSNRPWTYRHADGRHELLRDLYDLKAAVSLARSRGLGRAALEPVQQLADLAQIRHEAAHN